MCSASNVGGVIKTPKGSGSFERFFCAAPPHRGTSLENGIERSWDSIGENGGFWSLPSIAIITLIFQNSSTSTYSASLQ
jgi:hypothetical protein